MIRYSLVLGLLLASLQLVSAVTVSGFVLHSGDRTPVTQARVTLFTPDLCYFRETRSDLTAAFEFQFVGEGLYRLGVSALNLDYQELALTVGSSSVETNFFLAPQTNGGRWTIIGNTEPELLDGSASATVLPTGEIFFCHDTKDPIVFDPAPNLKWFPAASGQTQGCHSVTLDTSGGLFFTGGSMGGNPLEPIVKTAKHYWRNTNGWSRVRDNLVGRWYPGLLRLPDERLLILGGELNDPGYGRTNGCEIYDPRSNSWSFTGNFRLPTEIPPSVVLFNGQILKTWREPEFYDPASGVWRLAAPFLQPRIGAPGGDHSDHEIVHLPDGRVMAIGILPAKTNASTRFCEIYNPTNNTWTLGPNPRAVRGQPEALLLPDGRVLAFGGSYSGLPPSPVPLAPAGFVNNCTKVADLYDPASNSWRPLADLNRFIHYHNLTVLAPDGRVIATGGAGLTSNRSFAGDDSRIEAFEPPYLFRGVRPHIEWLSTTDLIQGRNFSLRFSMTAAPTKVILHSARAVTHWVDGGPQRQVALNFTQTSDVIEATVPANPNTVLAGWYLLMILTDDIPSAARMVRVLSAPAPIMELPVVSLAAVDSTASEPSGDIASFRVLRSGSTNAPLRVDLNFAGSAISGADYNALSNSVIVPAGAASILVKVTLRDDNLSEGAESLIVSLAASGGYAVGTDTNLVITLLDNEIAPPAPDLGFANLGGDRFELTLVGPGSRLYAIEKSIDLTDWQPFTTLVTLTNRARLTDMIPPNLPRLFFRARLKP